VATEITLAGQPAEALRAGPLLDIDGLSVGYRTTRGLVRALDGVSLSIGKGEALGLVGESGSGKSSVVLAILGLLGSEAVVRADRARFDGADLLANAPALRGRRIATVFQDPSSALNPALSIGLQLCEPFTVHRGLGLEDARHRAGALLAEVGIPQVQRVLNAYPHQLSGGMKQRVAIAMALAADPDLLLLDEPTTALDVTVEAQILDLLEKLRERRGLSMLLVSHNLGIVDRLCDRLLVLYAGRALEAGPTPTVLHHPRHPYTGGLLGALPRIVPGLRFRLSPIPGNLPDLTLDEPGCNFRPRCAQAVPSCAAAQPLLALAPDHRVRCHRAVGVAPEAGAVAGEALGTAVASAAPPLIEATGLARRFGGGGVWSGLPLPAFLRGKDGGEGVLAVDGVSLAIRAGETLGLVGESGCGKSTLGRLLLRLISADAGRVSFDGADVPAQPGAAFRRRAQIVFQNPDSSLNPRMTVEAILRRPLRHFSLATGAQATAEIDRLLDLVRLPRDYRQRYPHQLSGGEKQRVGIARALASRPDFIVCDEAVSALDVSVQAAILNLLDELRRALGVAYLFISHDIGVIAQIADRIAVMYRGRIVEEGRQIDVLQPPYHPYTEALLSAVPVVGARDRDAGRVRLAGDPSAAGAASGCPFAPRCPRKLGPVCDTARPPRQVTASGHAIDCHISLTELGSVGPVFPAPPAGSPRLGSSLS